MAGELVVSTINGAGFDGGNVIINPEFTINQRGAASRTAATGYNFDRWYYDGTRLLQGVEGNNLRAGTYVLSWSGSSTAEFSLNTAAASGQGSESYTAVTNGGTITIASVGSNNLWVRFSSDLTNLTRVKLSPGTEASGFVARPFGTELQLCQRYFEKSFPVGTAPIASNFSGAVRGINAGSPGSGCDAFSVFMIPFKVQKRASPTMTTFSGTAIGQIRYFRNTGATVDGGTGGASSNESIAFVSGSFAGSGSLSDVRFVLFDFTASAEL
jgi:hypothetical protein